MSVIPAGTLCIVVGIHELAGTTQTVIEGPTAAYFRCPLTAQAVHADNCYIITGPPLDRGRKWIARRSALIPIVPPTNKSATRVEASA